MGTATSNGPTFTPAAMGTPVSTTSSSKMTFNDTISATKEYTTSAKDKKPAPLTSSASTDASLVNPSSTVITSTTSPTAKMPAKELLAEGKRDLLVYAIPDA